jgi:hypothetical protein
MNLSVALICEDHDQCDGFPRATFTVIGKVGRDIAQVGSHFRLLNDGECRFMRTLDSHIDDNCRVPGSPDDAHIIEADSLTAGDLLPTLLTCAQIGAIHLKQAGND